MPAALVLLCLLLSAPAAAQYLDLPDPRPEPVTTLKAPTRPAGRIVEESDDVDIEYMPNTPEGKTLMEGEVKDRVNHLTSENEKLSRRLEEISREFNALRADNAVRFKELEESNRALGAKLNALEAKPAAAAAKPGAAETPQQSAKTPEKLYDESYAALQAKKYAEAEAGFKEFLKGNPKHKLAGNAQYWLGETYYVRGRYENASVAFAEGYKNHKASSKGPDSLIKLGLSMSRLKRKDEACAAFVNFPAEFPKASADLKKRAAAEAGMTL